MIVFDGHPVAHGSREWAFCKGDRRLPLVYTHTCGMFAGSFMRNSSLVFK